METSAYLYIKRRDNWSGRTSVRATKTKGACASNEIVIRVDFSIPNALFDRPQLTASILVPDEAVPTQIEAETIDNIKQAIEQAIDLKVNFQVEGIKIDEEDHPALGENN